MEEINFKLTKLSVEISKLEIPIEKIEKLRNMIYEIKLLTE